MLEKFFASDDADEIAVEAHDQNEACHPGQPLHQSGKPIRGEQENGVESLRVAVVKQPLHDVRHLVCYRGIDISDRHGGRGRERRRRKLALACVERKRALHDPMSVILAPEGRVELMLCADLLQEALGRIRGRQVERVDQYRAKRKGQDAEKRHAALGAAVARRSVASEVQNGDPSLE